MRRFCTTGSIDPEHYYFIPRRLDWQLLEDLVQSMLYFSIHAPRQSGKSTAAQEYVKYLKSRGQYKAVYCSLDGARNTGDDEDKANRAILCALETSIADAYPEDAEILQYFREMETSSHLPREAVRFCLKYWCKNSTKPIVLFLDEVDGLDEKPLVLFLAQIRSGFEQDRRNNAFPRSMGLISMRHIKDYQVPKGNIEGERRYSPFNIISRFIRLEDFSEREVEELLCQHTQETGQKFHADAIAEIYRLSQGQPWLVNALAEQACFQDVLDRAKPITSEIIQHAKSRLILGHQTHIDNLLERLKEPRVRYVVDAVLAGEEHIMHRNVADVEYTRNLGILKQKAFEFANPIYQEVIPRILSQAIQDEILQSTAWYLDTEGSLNMVRLLEAFTQFYRENAEALLPNISYHESYPHLLLMAFLQRIINGGGEIIREFALGKKSADLFIKWKQQKFVLELKVKRSQKALAEGLVQIFNYIDSSNAEGHLIEFDRDALLQKKNWEGRIGHRVEHVNGRKVHVWTM